MNFVAVPPCGPVHRVVEWMFANPDTEEERQQRDRFLREMDRGEPDPKETAGERPDIVGPRPSDGTHFDKAGEEPEKQEEVADRSLESSPGEDVGVAQAKLEAEKKFKEFDRGVDGTRIPVPRAFDHHPAPQGPRSTRTSGNASYKPPGLP